MKRSRLTTALLGLLLILPLGAAAPDPFALMKAEAIGPLRLGMPIKQLPALPGCKPKLGPEQLWGADGAYHQDWDAPSCGLHLNLVSDKPKQPKTIFSIRITAPNKLASKRGIKVGSTEAQARKAYGAAYNGEESQAGQTLVFGSIYGGLICTLNKGKVSEIFLGAAAE